jgi:tetratricopeptide (TPR) repeat protein
LRDARLVGVAVLAAMMASCGQLGGFTVARANRLFSDGYAHEAAALYLRAGAGREPVASYDLANAFVELGEPGAARPLFDVAIGSGDVGIAMRSWYNLGAAAFAAADYQAAGESFKKALEAWVAEAASNPGLGAGRPAEQAFRHEVARAWELSLEAASKKHDSGATERGRYGAGDPGGGSRPFTLSRPDERTLFAPGGSGSDAAVDH